MFTISTILAVRDLGIPIDVINVNGGCVSLGYPSGAVGGKAITSLINCLNINKKRLGIAAVSNGTGSAQAILIENLRL